MPGPCSWTVYSKVKTSYKSRTSTVIVSSLGLPMSLSTSELVGFWTRTLITPPHWLYRTWLLPIQSDSWKDSCHTFSRSNLSWLSRSHCVFLAGLSSQWSAWLCCLMLGLKAWATSLRVRQSLCSPTSLPLFLLPTFSKLSIKKLRQFFTTFLPPQCLPKSIEPSKPELNLRVNVPFLL